MFGAGNDAKRKKGAENRSIKASCPLLHAAVRGTIEGEGAAMRGRDLLPEDPCTRRARCLRIEGAIGGSTIVVEDPVVFHVNGFVPESEEP